MPSASKIKSNRLESIGGQLLRSSQRGLVDCLQAFRAKGRVKARKQFVWRVSQRSLLRDLNKMANVNNLALAVGVPSGGHDFDRIAGNRGRPASTRIHAQLSV